MEDATCRECGKSAWSDGLCRSHHFHWARTVTIGQRFWAKVSKDSPVPAHRPELGPCWIWIGARNLWGYGVFQIGGDPVAAHRWSYEHEVGLIAAGLHLDHTCDSRSCVAARPPQSGHSLGERAAERRTDRAERAENPLQVGASVRRGKHGPSAKRWPEMQDLLTRGRSPAKGLIQ